MKTEFSMREDANERQLTAAMYVVERNTEEIRGDIMTERQGRLRCVATVLVAQIASEEFSRVAGLFTSAALLTEVDKTAANETLLTNALHISGAISNLKNVERRVDMTRKVISSFMDVHNALRNLSDSSAKYNADGRVWNLFSNDDFRGAVSVVINASRNLLDKSYVDEETKRRIKSNNAEIKRTLGATARGIDSVTKWKNVGRISSEDVE